jgi:hypothetical protein
VPDPVLYEAALEWAALFNSMPPEAVGEVIAESGNEEYFDDRTNLFLMAPGEPTDLALVLSAADEPDSDDYVVVRWVGDAWAVDSGPVDWEALEEAAFDESL